MLRDIGVNLPEEAVYAGITKAHWPARFEKLMAEPLVFYDGAHNPQGIRGAVENIKTYLAPTTEDGKVVLCMGVLKDKDFSAMIGALAPLADRVFTITPDNPRALPAAETAAVFRDLGTAAESADTLATGVENALRYAQTAGRPLVVLGSLYIYGDVKKALNR